jgi:hypothetical protein
MNMLGYGLIVIGVVLFAIGYARAREPWRRYQGLKAQDANAARYRAWRGGPASASDEKTGASVAMDILRREVRTWGAVTIVGVVLVVVGFILAAT